MIYFDVDQVTAAVESRTGSITAVRAYFYVSDGIGQTQFGKVAAAVEGYDAGNLLAVVGVGHGHFAEEADTAAGKHRVFLSVVGFFKFEYRYVVCVQRAVGRSDVFVKRFAGVICVLNTFAVGLGVPACKRVQTVSAYCGVERVRFVIGDGVLSLLDSGVLSLLVKRDSVRVCLPLSNQSDVLSAGKFSGFADRLAVKQPVFEGVAHFGDDGQTEVVACGKVFVFVFFFTGFVGHDVRLNVDFFPVGRLIAAVVANGNLGICRLKLQSVLSRGLFFRNDFTVYLYGVSGCAEDAVPADFSVLISKRCRKRAFAEVKLRRVKRIGILNAVYRAADRLYASGISVAGGCVIGCGKHEGLFFRAHAEFYRANLDDVAGCVFNRVPGERIFVEIEINGSCDRVSRKSEGSFFRIIVAFCNGNDRYGNGSRILSEVGFGFGGLDRFGSCRGGNLNYVFLCVFNRAPGEFVNRLVGCERAHFSKRADELIRFGIRGDVSVCICLDYERQALFGHSAFGEVVGGVFAQFNRRYMIVFGIFALDRKIIARCVGHALELQSVAFNLEFLYGCQALMFIIRGCGSSFIRDGNYVFARLYYTIVHVILGFGRQNFFSLGSDYGYEILSARALRIPGNTGGRNRYGKSVGIPNGVQSAVVVENLSFVFIRKLISGSVNAHPPAKQFLAFLSDYGQIIKLAVHGFSRADLLRAVFESRGERIFGSIFDKLSVKRDVARLVYVEFIRFRKICVGVPALEHVSLFFGSGLGRLHLLSVSDGSAAHSGAAVKHERYDEVLVLEEFVLLALVRQLELSAFKRSVYLLASVGVYDDCVSAQIKRTGLFIAGNVQAERRTFEADGVFRSVLDTVIICSHRLSRRFFGRVAAASHHGECKRAHRHNYRQELNH